MNDTNPENLRIVNLDPPEEHAITKREFEDSLPVTRGEFKGLLLRHLAELKAEGLTINPLEMV